MTRFSPETVLITGASRGIGRALTEYYLAHGATVYAAARAIAPETFQQGKGTLVPLTADITIAADRQSILAGIAGQDRPLDLVVNNAGIQQALDMTALAADAFAPLVEAEIAINLTAPILLAQSLLPFLRQPGGHIVNVTSLLARHAKPSAPVYSATKAGLAQFTKALRHQCAPLGITVSEALPPLVDTDMTAGRGTGKLSAKDMAEAIALGVETRKPIIAPGKSRLVLTLDRVVPELVERMMQKA